MSKVAEIKARIAADQEALKDAIKGEKTEALKRIRQEIKDFGFKTSDFKGVLATRAKRSPNGTRAAKNVAAKKTSKG